MLLLCLGLNPFVSTLPPENIPINVNTASAEVLKSLGEIDPTIVENIITDRETAAFENINDFMSASGLTLDNTTNNSAGTNAGSGQGTTTPESNINNPAAENTQPTTIQGQSIDVISTYFLLKGTIQIGRARLYVNTTLHRNKEGKVSIVQREFIKHIL